MVPQSKRERSSREPLSRRRLVSSWCIGTPSGDPEPSTEDVRVTERMAEAGQIIGIELVDHVVIGDDSFVSMRERGLLSS